LTFDHVFLGTSVKTIFEIVDLAAVIACQGRELVVEQFRLSATSISNLWSASRCRLDAWDFDLAIYSRAAAQNQCELGDRLERLVLEIAASDALTRTLAAFCSAHDRHHHRSDATQVGDNMLAAQKLATRRALSLLGDVNASHAAMQKVGQLRQTAQQLATFTDCLIAPFAPFTDVSRYLPAPSQFAGSQPASACELSLRAQPFRTALRVRCINEVLNQSIAAAVIGLFGPELLDSYGSLRATMNARIDRLTGDTESLILSGLN
jgi:hypothetical protein